jgi:hypothetical protein
MNKLFLFVLGLIIASQQTFCASELIMGTIQFPYEAHTGSDVPHVRVYCGGRKIKCETDKESKKITFTVPRERKQDVFHVLVTKDFSYETVAQPGSSPNLISHLCVNPHCTYKLFEMKVQEPDAATKAKNEQASQTPRAWQIKEVFLPDNKRVPDNAIIIYYDPACIEKPSGGRALELPTITVKKDIMTEQNLFDLSNELLLSALDNDALHAPAQEQQVRFEYGRALIAPTA